VAHMLMFCVYLLCENVILYYLYVEVIQSALMCYIPKFLREKNLFRCQISILMMSKCHVEIKNFH
jgi:hypothetical protein